MSKVDDLHDAENQREPDGEEAVIGAQRQEIYDKLSKIDVWHIDS